MNEVQRTLRRGSADFENISTKDITLPELLAQAREIAYDSKDYTVKKENAKKIHLNDDAGLTFIGDDGNSHSFAMSRYAMGQLGNKVGIPVSYIESCKTIIKI